MSLDLCTYDTQTYIKHIHKTHGSRLMIILISIKNGTEDSENHIIRSWCQYLFSFFHKTKVEKKNKNTAKEMKTNGEKGGRRKIIITIAGWKGKINK